MPKVHILLFCSLPSHFFFIISVTGLFCFGGRHVELDFGVLDFFLTKQRNAII